jgi:hypothetical protein
MKFSKLVENVSKRPIPAGVKRLIVEVMVMDEDGEDVEVRIHLTIAVRWLTLACTQQVPFIVVGL